MSRGRGGALGTSHGHGPQVPKCVDGRGQGAFCILHRSTQAPWKDESTFSLAPYLPWEQRGSSGLPTGSGFWGHMYHVELEGLPGVGRPASRPSQPFLCDDLVRGPLPSS